MMEKCPRCGLEVDAVETIKAERMPDRNGNRVYDLVGHVYYHPSRFHCAVPRVGEAYTICPANIQVAPSLTGMDTASSCCESGNLR